MTTSPPAPIATPSPLAIFRKRSFTLLWIGQFVSTVGSSLTSLAASILVYRLTGSALSVSLMLMATALPTVLVGLIAGVFVDRLDRRRVMIAADALRAVLVALIPILIPYSIAWLYIVVALTSAIGQFFDPAHESVLPDVASDDELAAANSLIAISSFGSTAIGFAASGLIASQFPIEWAFYIDALTFLISAGCILALRIPPFTADGSTTVAVVLRNLRAGASFLFNTPSLRSLFLVLVPVFIGFGLWNSLLLPFALRALNATEFEYGVQEALTSIGFVVGSLLMARLGERLREGQWLVISFLGMGAVGLVYALSTSIPLAILLVTISGLLNAPSSVARRLVIQRQTPRELRGRVNSAFFVARDVVFLAGMGLAGLADVYDVRWLMIVSGVLVLAAGLWALVMPGLGLPAAEWRQALRLLTTAGASSLGASRAATVADFDALVGHLPSLGTLAAKDRQAMLAQARVGEVPEGTAIIRHGEAGDAAYFVLAGQLVAGIAGEEGRYRSLSTLGPGDFFGEIAALTGSARTANVVASEPATVMQVPAAALRGLMGNAAVSQLILTKMNERLSRTYTADLPRLAGVDQQDMRDLRTASSET